MVYYKLYRIIDGKPRWVIEDEDGNINKSPTKELLKECVLDNRRKTKIQKDRKCGRCGRLDTYIDKKGNPIWLIFKNGYICSRCNTRMWKHGYISEEKIIEKRKEYSDMKRNKYFEGRICCICGLDKTYMKGDTPVWSTHDVCNYDNCTGFICASCSYKSKSKLRNGIFTLSDIFDGDITWFIGECVVCKTVNVKNRNIEENNFWSKTDTLKHQIYGYIEIKTVGLNEGKWQATIGRHEFDSLIILCMDKGNKKVKRVYIISDIKGLNGISLYENTRLTISKWEEFRIDEKLYDDNYQNLLLYLKDKEFFGIEDLNNWLKGE